MVVLVWYYCFVVFFILPQSDVPLTVVNESSITLELPNHLFVDDDQYYALLLYGSSLEQKTSPIRLLVEDRFFFLFFFLSFFKFFIGEIYIIVIEVQKVGARVFPVVPHGWLLRSSSLF
jgi:hypothetical protein